jgi:hypothetical protein
MRSFKAFKPSFLAVQSRLVQYVDDVELLNHTSDLKTHYKINQMAAGLLC